MEIIEKATDVRAADNKHNLLMYIVDQVEATIGGPFFKNDIEEINDAEIVSKLPIN